MARTTKRGTCDLCGASSSVGNNHGSKVCTNCTHVQSALNKRPQSVANAIRAMGKTEELLGHLIPAGGLAVHVTAELLREISGIVGYDGEDPAELVAAVRRRVLTCASCDAEDVLHEIREIVGYSADMGDSGLADAVRRLALRDASSDCADCTALRVDLLRACGLEMDDTEDGEGWDVAAAAAIQEIAELTNRRDHLLALLTRERADNAGLRNEITRLNGQAHSESEQVTALRDDLTRSTGVIEQLRAEITLLEQAHDEWEQRAVQAEQNVETLEAELQERDRDEDRSFNRLGLLDIAIAALRGDAVPADQIAGLLAIARKVSA